MSAYVLIFILKASYGISIPYAVDNFHTLEACQAEKQRIQNALGDKVLYINCAPKNK